jgi:hypothetical protein
MRLQALRDTLAREHKDALAQQRRDHWEQMHQVRQVPPGTTRCKPPRRRAYKIIPTPSLVWACGLRVFSNPGLAVVGVEKGLSMLARHTTCEQHTGSFAGVYTREQNFGSV